MNIVHYVDNILIPFLVIHGSTLAIAIIVLSFILEYNANQKGEDLVEEEDLVEQHEYIMENLRDQIESISSDDNSYKTIQSIVLPKKGDYVEIKEGRWQGYVGRITNIMSDSYNINISKKDNYDVGNDIPPFLLKNKLRDYFTVLTDNELKMYNILDENEEMDRYILTDY